MYNIFLNKDANGCLNFKSENGGRLVDISNETRAKLLNKKNLIKQGQEIRNKIFITKNQPIMNITKSMDNTIDGLYIKYKKNNIIIVEDNTLVEWLSNK